MLPPPPQFMVDFFPISKYITHKKVNYPYPVHDNYTHTISYWLGLKEWKFYRNVNHMMTLSHSGGKFLNSCFLGDEQASFQLGILSGRAEVSVPTHPDKLWAVWLSKKYSYVFHTFSAAWRVKQNAHFHNRWKAAWVSTQNSRKMSLVWVIGAMVSSLGCVNKSQGFPTLPLWPQVKVEHHKLILKRN